MGFFVRTLFAVLVLGLTCAAPADAGRSVSRAASASPAELKRAAARAERDAAAAAQSRAFAERAVTEAELRLREFNDRAQIGSARAAQLQAAAAAAETAAARALASLSLAARGAAPAPPPALAGLAGRLGASAANARNEADEAHATMAMLEAERRAAFADLDRARAERDTASAAAQTAAANLTALRAEVKIAERAEADRRLAEQRARKHQLAAARSSAASKRAGAGAANTVRLDWMTPVRGGSARFGGAGGTLTIAARAGADVLAPIDGEITYAGLFRTYGQVLILSGSDGYAFVLSGMDRIYGTTGRFVRRGERIGVLPARESAELGLELRKNGTPIAADRWAKDEIKPRKGDSNGDRRMTASLR